MGRASESRREEALSALSALFAKHRRLPFPSLEGLPRNVGAEPDLGSKLLMYDSAVAGWVARTLEGKALSEVELHNLNAATVIHRELDDLRRGNQITPQLISRLREYLASLDELARLVKIAQGIK